VIELKTPLAKLGNRLGPHGRRAMTLVGGTSTAQLIPLAIAPLLTRLYTPADYGILAIFGSIVAVLTAVAAGRYTVAIMLPDNDRDAVQVTGLALFLAALVSALLLLLVPVALWLMGGVSMIHDLDGWLYLVPVAVFLGSMFESLGYFSLRKDKVSQIAQANVLKTAISGGTQVSLGFLGVGLPGLLGGFLLGLATGNFRLIRIYADSLHAYRLHWPQMKSMAAKYSNFPRYDLWGNLANILSYNIITIGVGAIYAYHALGQYALAFRTASLPSALIGVALGQVYMREAARRVNSPALALRAFYRTVALLAAASVVPMAVIGLWGEELFGLIFGPEWRPAGIYAAAMMPLVWARFISSPMSPVFYIYGKQRVLLMFQIILLVVIAATMTTAFKQHWSLQELLLVQSSLLGGFYIVLLHFARRTIIQSGAAGVRSEQPTQ
jgi:O-antigen/teichoic acid export membrane protein